MKRKIPLILFALFELFVIILLLACISSCSPLKRLERMQTRHPQLFNRENDTMIVRDTIRIVIPGTRIDSSVSLEKLRVDPFFLHKDNLHVKAWILNDSVFIQAKTDTIIKGVIRELKVPYKKNVTYRRPRDYLREISSEVITAFVWIAVSVIFYIIYRYIQKRK